VAMAMAMAMAMRATRRTRKRNRIPSSSRKSSSSDSTEGKMASPLWFAIDFLVSSQLARKMGSKDPLPLWTSDGKNVPPHHASCVRVSRFRSDLGVSQVAVLPISPCLISDREDARASPVPSSSDRKHHRKRPRSPRDASDVRSYVRVVPGVYEVEIRATTALQQLLDNGWYFVTELSYKDQPLAPDAINLYRVTVNDRCYPTSSSDQPVPCHDSHLRSLVFSVLNSGASLEAKCQALEHAAQALGPSHPAPPAIPRGHKKSRSEKH